MSVASEITKTSFRLDFVNNIEAMVIRIRVNSKNAATIFEKSYYRSIGGLFRVTASGLEPGVTYTVKLDKKIHSSYHTPITPDIEVTTLADPVTVDTITKTQIHTTVRNDTGESAFFRVLFIHALDDSTFKVQSSSPVPVGGTISIVGTGLFPGETYGIKAQYGSLGTWVDLGDEINVDMESIDVSDISLSVEMGTRSASVEWIHILPDILFRFSVFMEDGTLHSSYGGSHDPESESDERSLMITGLKPESNYIIKLYMEKVLI